MSKDTTKQPATTPATPPATAPTTAPATTAAAAATDAKKRKQAEHGYIANGKPTDEQEQATGCTYTDVKTAKSVSFEIPGAKPGSVQTMLAAFGLKTLMTNTASGNRNAVNGPQGDDISAINARLAELKDGQWAIAAEGARGPKVDIDVLAGVLFDTAKKAGKTQTSWNKPVDVLTYREKLNDDLPYRRSVMQVVSIRDEYRKRAGVTGPTVDDVI